MNYYNEHDPKAAHWLRSLIAAGLIPDGEVDGRSIEDVQPSDLAGFRQCHFFAGIGGWSRALELAGVPADVRLWTGSCPCQPLSSAGKRAGEMDERHLWPEFARLIAQCRPATIFGEQVASSDGREWLAGVRLDLEELGYAVGAADLPAASVAAPHRRNRLFWVAQSGVEDEAWRLLKLERPCSPGQRLGQVPAGAGAGTARSGGLPDAEGNGRQQGRAEPAGQQRGCDAADDCGDGSLGDAERRGCTSGPVNGTATEVARTGCSNSFWGDHWQQFSDGKARRIERGAVLLVDGVSVQLADGTRYSKQEVNRVAALRGLGNAIVPQVAAEFIKAAFAEISYHGDG